MRPLIKGDTDRAGIGALIVAILFAWFAILAGIVYNILTAQPAPIWVPAVML